MQAFVVLGLVFSVLTQEIALGKRLRNELFSVKWDVKPQLSESVNQLLMPELSCKPAAAVVH